MPARPALVASLSLLLAPLALAKPPAAAGIVFPKGTQLQASYANNEEPKFKPEEKVAYLILWSIHSLEERCHSELDRYCKLDELVRGIPGKDKRIIGLKIDPARDPNYTYAVDVSSAAPALPHSSRAKLPVASQRTMEEIYSKSLARTSFTLVMLELPPQWRWRSASLASTA